MRLSDPLRLVLPACLFAAGTLVAPPSVSADASVVVQGGTVRGVIDLANGRQIVAIEPPARSTGGTPNPPAFTGDAFSFEHQLGALINGVFQCFSEHTSGMDDNTVLFDGLSEFLDAYLNGTQPSVFEFETPNGDSTDAFFNSFTDASGDDLFPEGFTDPDTGTPLTDACIEIGIDDTLDGDQPTEVTSATIEASGPGGTIIPETDITSFFSNPFDGRLSIVFPGMAGEGIDGVVIEMTTQMSTFDPNSIFADGFESGDASAWSSTVP